MQHVILLGDSIFDNAAYVGAGEPDVVRQLREQLPRGWQATLRAVDGGRIRHVAAQTERLPADATHLVLSVGGNDALGHAGLLGGSARSMADALTQLAQVADDFEHQYRSLLDDLLARALPLAVCTVYNPRFTDALTQRLAVTALCVFNDAITRAAFERGLPLIDLRLICAVDADYANPIEPSARGGSKIASAISRAVIEHDFSIPRTEVFI